MIRNINRFLYEGGGYMKRYKVVYVDSAKNIVRSTEIMTQYKCDMEELCFNALPKYGDIRKGLTAKKIEVGDW